MLMPSAPRPIMLTAPSEAPLATFVFGECVPLELLSGEASERWLADDTWHQVSVSVPDFLQQGTDPEASPVGSVEASVEAAFSTLYADAQSAGFEVVRVWNYMPDINVGDDDAEIYKRFCVGRARGVPKTAQGHPAATVIGTDTARDALVIQALLRRTPGTPIENPRQVPAWQYPRQFGPTSPGFVRGMVVDNHLLASGTASVIGHATQWPGDVVEQTRECVRNLQALVAEAGGRWAQAAPTLRVYVRDVADSASVQATLEQMLPPETRLAMLRGDICRRDLLVEIDGVFTLR